MQLKRTIDSDFKAIPALIEEALILLKREVTLSEQDVFDLTLVLEEALTNAIKHGNKGLASADVDFEMSCDGNRLSITVEDSGAGFDPQKVPDPTRNEGLMKTSGRGIYLIEKIMDEVIFLKNGRQIRMIKHLDKKS